MAITSIGYDDPAGVDEQDWAALAAYLGHLPTVASTTALKVTSVVGPDRTVRIAAGSGYADGVLDTSTTTVDVQLATIGSGTRWDAVVVRRAWATNLTTFTAVTGTSTKALPAGLLVSPGVSADQVLALVQVTVGQSTPTAVIDLRRLPDGSLASWEARGILGEGAPAPVALGVASGFTGFAELYAKASTASLRLQLTKSGSNIVNTTATLCTVPDSALPPAMWPGVVAVRNIDSGRINIDEVTGVVICAGLTISPGEVIQGSISWPIGS